MWGKIFFLWMRNHMLSVEKAACFSTRSRGKSVSRTTPLCEGLQMWIPSWWTAVAAAAGEGQPTPAVNSEFLGQVPGATPAPGKLPCSLLPPLHGGEPQRGRQWGGCAASRFQAISGILGQLWHHRRNGSWFLALWNVGGFLEKFPVAFEQSQGHSKFGENDRFSNGYKEGVQHRVQGCDLSQWIGLSETSNLGLHAL